MNKQLKRKFIHVNELETIPEEYPINPLFKNYYHLYGKDTDDEELTFLFIDGLIKLYTDNICKKIGISPDFDYVKNFNRFYNDDFNFTELKLYIQLSICKHSTKFSSEKSTFLDSEKMKQLISLVMSSETYDDFIYNCYKRITSKPLSNHDYNELINDGLVSALKFSNLYNKVCEIKTDLALGNDLMYSRLFPINNKVGRYIKTTFLMDLGKIYLRWSSILEKKQNYTEDGMKLFSKYKGINISIFLSELQSIFIKCITDYINKSLLSVLFQINFVPNFQNYIFTDHETNLINLINKNKTFLLEPILQNEIYSIELPEDLVN